MDAGTGVLCCTKATFLLGASPCFQVSGARSGLGVQSLGWVAENLPRAPSGPQGPAGARPRTEAGLAWRSMCCGVAVEHGPSWAEKGPRIHLPLGLHQEAEAWGPARGLVAWPPPGAHEETPQQGEGPRSGAQARGVQRPRGRVGLGFSVPGLWWALCVCSAAQPRSLGINAHLGAGDRP